MKREDYKLLPLAAVGVAKGVLEVYVKPLFEEVRPSSIVWSGLLGSALLYDVLAPEGDTLSERYADFSEAHPVLALGALAVTVGHLTDVLPDSVDPFHLVADRLRHGL